MTCNALCVLYTRAKEYARYNYKTSTHTLNGPAIDEIKGPNMRKSGENLLQVSIWL